ncbi:CHAP domain-containing protein [Kribbella sp. NPDC050459]|uniref:CHAP domain-containing protein n=1 Tax=Kribbella sp. NPDC050459 TaxID=3155785 RepID=UPI0033EA0DA3
MIVKIAAAAALLVTGACLLPPLAVARSGADTCDVAQAVGEASLDAEQTSNLAVIMGVGDRYGIGEAGKVVAVMTAMTESSLRNVDHGDTAGPDSRGLFQQRDSWGTLGERLDPASAAGLFYAALANVPGWASMEPWKAAQAVQRSAFADGSNYRRNYEAAVRLVRASPTAGVCGSWGAGDTDQLPGASVAVDRALALVGSHGYYQLCARLASNIWGRSHSGYVSAAEQWAQMVSSGNAHPDDRRPPVGALLFWSTDGPYGHVAVYVGNGRIVSNDIGDRMPGEGGVYLVGVEAIEQRWGATYLGWAPPVYPTTT